MAEPADVFISYSREDKEKVLALTAKLRAAGVPLCIYRLVQKDAAGAAGATTSRAS